MERKGFKQKEESADGTDTVSYTHLWRELLSVPVQQSIFANCRAPGNDRIDLLPDNALPPINNGNVRVPQPTSYYDVGQRLSLIHISNQSSFKQLRI